MSLKRKILRALVWVIGSLFGILLVLVASIHLDQYLLRRKAERLLADIQSLELRKSTYADARRVMDRWKNDLYEQEPCQQDLCDVQIGLGNFTWRHLNLFVAHQRLFKMYRKLGGRPARIGASIGTRRGIVWRKEVEAWVDFPDGYDEDGHMVYVTLIGRAGSGRIVGSALHPEYRMGQPSGCTGCIAGWVTFTPYTDPVDIKRLMDINLSCITRWHPCKTREDILPAAWQQDKSVPLAEHWRCTPEVVRVMSREAERVAIGKITKTEKSSSEGQVTIQLEENLKPHDSRMIHNDYQYLVDLPIKERRGDRYIFFLDQHGRSWNRDARSGEECTLSPATAENMEAVKQGIAEDWQYLFRTRETIPGGMPIPLKSPKIDMK